MKKLFVFLSCLIFLFIQAWGQVSDSEVIKMLQEARDQGMTQKQMAVMLMQKGVTQEQLLRLKKAYESGKLDIGTVTNPVPQERLRQLPVQGEKKTASSGDTRYIKEAQSGGNWFLPDQRSGMSYMDSLVFYMKKPLTPEQRENSVFGRDIFNNEVLTFEPQLNIATPDNYMLGPGDEVIIDVWGAAQANIRQIISPDGDIIVEGLGPIHLSGLTVKEANARIKNELGKIYAGVTSGSSSLKLTLGNIRSIQVNVMGEVVAPGTYTLPSLASVFHALYNAGGVNDIGSLRTLKVYRGGKEIVDVDIYEYLMQGKNDLNITLQDGDVVIIAPYQNLVKVVGKVKRPMLYEMKKGEALNDLLDYAGGFRGDAYKKGVRVVRKSGREHLVFNVDSVQYADFVLTDGDVVTVDSVLNRFGNKVEIRGAVFRNGLYAIDGGISTVKQLIEKAEGVREDAFLSRGVLYREKPDLSLEVMPVDVAALLNGETADIPLRKNDVLYIPSVFDLQENYTIQVKGAVGKPGTYKYVDNMTLEDLVVQAGGLLESASTVKVDVARRIKNPKSTSVNDQRAETFTFTLKDGLVVDGQSDFILKPFDEIYIRRSPGYREQEDVFVSGEIMFEGEYALAKKGERLTDLVKKAGGLTPEAYPEGARLLRKSSPEERERIQQAILKLTQQGDERDSINAEALKLGEYYPVGIELKEAIENPESDYNVILKEGDRLIIPEYSGTVRINGAVMYPNTVVYKPKAKLSYYISQAGGYAQRAKKSKAFVIYMNGTVAIARGGRLNIKPGSEIIIPMKPMRKGWGLAEIMSVATSTTSMAALITSIINSSK